MASSMTDDCTMEIVMKNIYTSCDPENTNLVLVSKLIEFITPYMIEDLSALDCLKRSLDPESKNISVSSERFYEVMNEWAKKITNSADEECEFNKTPSLEAIDDKQLPYLQSTPRASFGQKLLHCEGLLNLSNVSGYSLSISAHAKETSSSNQDKTILEEEITRLEHQLNKVSNEMSLLKLQLATAEEQNDMLQADLDRCKTRLHSEQQMIEHLQNEKKYNDELRDELNACKKQIEVVNKKLQQCEKDNGQLHAVIKQNEQESTKLEQKCEELSRREQDAKKEIINIKTELDLKEQEITTVLRINDELKNKLNQQRDVIDQLSNENELLEHQKNSIEKAFRDNLKTKGDNLLYQFKTCLNDTHSSSQSPLHTPKQESLLQKVLKSSTPSTFNRSLPSPTSSDPNSPNSLKSSRSLPAIYSVEQMDAHGGSSEEEMYKEQGTNFCRRDSLQAEISQAVQDDYNASLMSFENHEKLFTGEESLINELQLKSELLQAKLDLANADNDTLRARITEMEEQTSRLELELDDLLKKLDGKEADLDQIRLEKNQMVMEMEELKRKLLDENNNKSEVEKSMSSALEAKNKIMLKLEQNLLELKEQFTSLQMENLAKERELSNKFNFETAYKEMQIELNEKNLELEALTESNRKLEERLVKSITSNEALERSLKQTELELRNTQDKLKEIRSLNNSIESTTSQVQAHLDRKNNMITELVDLNKKFESHLFKLREELESKIAEVSQLQNSLKEDMTIRNIMWRDNKELVAKLNDQLEINSKLSEDVKEMTRQYKADYDALLENYNEEVEKNLSLLDQISRLKLDLSTVTTKYAKEIEEVYVQVSALKDDASAIKQSQDEYKETINKKLDDYETIIDNLEKKLQHAQSENVSVKVDRRRSCKRVDSDSNLSESGRNISFEKQKLTIDRLKVKLEHTEEQLQREKLIRESLEQKLKTVVLEKQELRKAVDDFSDNIKAHTERYAKLETTLKLTQENLSVKLSQAEQQNQHLRTELKNNEVAIRNATLEIQTYKNLLKHSEQKAQELSSAMSAYVSETSMKAQEIQMLRSELIKRDNKILSLSSKVVDQDVELSTVLNNLTEKSKNCVALERENKTLQEMLSKSDDSKEKELLDIEQKLKSTTRLLQCKEMELSLIDKKVTDAKNELTVITNAVTAHEDIILDGRTGLSRASDLIFYKWHEPLEKEDMYDKLLSLKESEPSEKGGEICALDNKIKIAILLLEFLATKAPAPMEGNDHYINEMLIVNSVNQYHRPDTKTRKKFTLRPTKLTLSPLRSVSPDSQFTETNAEPSPTINFNTSKEIYVNADCDSQICEICHCSSDDTYFTAKEFSLSKDDFIEFTSFQNTFPNITDVFLEKIGLHESSFKQNLSKEETEEIFTTFAIQIALDAKDIKERLGKQKDRCTQQYDKVFAVVRDISGRLRDHRCIGASDPISPVFVLLEDIKFILRDLLQSTEQYGILICENRMMKCWNLVTNYMAILKQGVSKTATTHEVGNESGALASYGSEIKASASDSTWKTKEEINSSASVSSSNSVVKGRFKCCTAVKNSLLLSFSVIFLTLTLIVSLHWQCRSTVHENQVCILDDFIKKIQIGNPPY